MLLVAKAAACPPDAARPRRNSSASFYQFWAAAAGAAAAAGHPECLSGGAAACRAQPACYLPLFERQLVGHSSGEAAAAAAAAQPGTVDAVLDLTAWVQRAEQATQRLRHVAPPLERQAAGSQLWQLPLSTGGGGLSSAAASPSLLRYSIRMNHTDVPPTRMRLNQVSPQLGQPCRGVCGREVGRGGLARAAAHVPQRLGSGGCLIIGGCLPRAAQCPG